MTCIRILIIIAALAMAASALNPECDRHGPEATAIKIIVTHFDELGAVAWLDSCLEWRDCKETYMVLHPDVRRWTEYWKAKYFIDEAVNDSP